MKDEIFKKKNYKKIELLEDKIKKKTIFNEKKSKKINRANSDQSIEPAT
jgi:hypothetical protein